MRLSGKERRASILEAAAELIEQYGFRGTSTQAIARQAGVSDALIFKHFDTLDELYRELCMQFITPLTDIPLEIGAGSPQQVLYDYITRFLTKNLQNPRSFRLYAMAQYERPGLVRLLNRSTEHSDTLTQLEDLLAEQFEDSEAASWRIRLLHHALMDMTRQYNLNAGHEEEFDIGKTAEMLSRFVIEKQ